MQGTKPGNAPSLSTPLALGSAGSLRALPLLNHCCGREDFHNMKTSHRTCKHWANSSALACESCQCTPCCRSRGNQTKLDRPHHFAAGALAVTGPPQRPKAPGTGPRACPGGGVAPGRWFTTQNEHIDRCARVCQPHRVSFACLLFSPQDSSPGASLQAATIICKQSLSQLVS